MEDTRIICPEWARVEEEPVNKTKQNQNTDMKPNLPERSRSRASTPRLYYLLLCVGMLLLLLFCVYIHTTYDKTLRSSPHSRHRDKRQSGTCQVDMCLTQECIHTASSILNSIDTSVDPCDDFFKYTCGNWIKENIHKTGIDDLFFAINHNSLPEKTDLILSELLRHNLPIAEEFLETKPYQNLFTFHESCLFVGHMNDGDYVQAMEILRSLEEFQIGRPFKASSWNLTKALLELMRINGAPLIDVIIQSDVNRPGKYAINVTPPRRYGLIPGLIGPRLRNPGVEEYFKLKSRRALFGDLSDDLIMLELLSSLEDRKPTEKKALRKDADGSFSKDNFEGRGGSLLEKRSGGVVSSVVGKPSLNVLPMDDFLEKTTAGSPNLPLTNPWTSKTTTTTTTSTTTEAPITTLFSRESFTEEASTILPQITTATKTPRPASTSPQSTAKYQPTTTSYEESTSTTASDSTSQSPSSAMLFNSSENMLLGVTELGPNSESTNFPNYEEEDPDYQENTVKIVSRKAVFKLFRRNIDKKRTESIGAMVQNSFSNISEEVWESSFGDYQPEDIYSAVIDHFVPLLDEIQPTEQEELFAQQHALLYNHFTLKELQDLVPMIEWSYLLSELFNKTITEEDNIYVYHPAYLRQLNLLLTALDPWVIHYGLVALYAYDILREITLPSPEMDREDFCLQATKNVFGDVMSHMYLHHIGNKTIQDIRKHTTSILDNLREEVTVSLGQATWLTASDQQEALNKLNGLKAEVGALDNHWDISYVNQSHERLTLSRDDSFLQNVMMIYRVFRTELYSVYHEPIDRDLLIWSFTVQPFVVNAFHMQTTNTIVFPEAFFQKPYYTARAPEYINYGSAGSSIAHEIFHGMDFTGTLFDHTGAMSRPFSNDSRFHLRKIVECYHKLLTDAFYEEVPVDQTLISMEIDSTTTLNENLADIGGIRHAFRAYQRWEMKNYREPRLPAIALNAYQLFFVAAVRPYCAVIPNLAKIFLMEMDEHLPNGMRMNGMLMNTPEFASVFNCQPGSRMVANQTCPIFR